MTRSAVAPTDSLKRIPGLFRRWELAEMFEVHRHYHIEEAGTHSDGTPLVAIYVSDAGRQLTVDAACSASPAAVEVHRVRNRPPSIELLVTEVGLLSWLHNAGRGDAFEYHRGLLAVDRLALGSRLPIEDARELDRVATAAMAAAGSGRAHLIQRRHGEDDYSYLIVASSGGAGVRKMRKTAS